MSDPADGGTQGVKGQLRRILHLRSEELPPSNAVEPCAACGEETTVGSVLYSDRHDVVLEDGRLTFLCDECYGRARAAKGGELTDADMRVIAKNGVMVASGFLNGGRW